MYIHVAKLLTSHQSRLEDLEVRRNHVVAELYSLLFCQARIIKMALQTRDSFRMPWCFSVNEFLNKLVIFILIKSACQLPGPAANQPAVCRLYIVISDGDGGAS